MTVLIAGGGIGGLTLALSLHQIGVPVRVFESVPELRPLGVGINVLPHAMARAERLGLHDAHRRPRRAHGRAPYYFKHGQPIWSEPRGIARRVQMAADSRSIAARCSSSCSTRSCNAWATSRACRPSLSGWSETRAISVEAPSSTRRPANREAPDGVLLIAADGIHSAVRAKLYPGRRAADLERPHPVARHHPATPSCPAAP